MPRVDRPSLSTWGTICSSGALVRTALLHRTHDELCVTARVPLRVFVQFGCPNLRYLQVREAGDLLFSEERNGHELESRLLHAVHSTASIYGAAGIVPFFLLDPLATRLLTSAFRIPSGEGTMCANRTKYRWLPGPCSGPGLRRDGGFRWRSSWAARGAEGRHARRQRPGTRRRCSA